MEMLCDKCIHGYDGTPDLVCHECQDASITRDKSDYVIACSEFKQKPLITVDGKTIGKIFDGKTYTVKPGICPTCSKQHSAACTMSVKSWNERHEIDGCSLYSPVSLTMSKDEAVVKMDPPEVPSAYAAANKRINELSGGISYLTGCYGDSYKSIRRYAKEILAQCDLIERCIKEEQP